ncbi:MAG: endoribonuclease MazF [Verrucomicrobia bacterium]|nr:endoribonuclease MazF [Verrucomicrobiota bacterium]
MKNRVPERGDLVWLDFQPQAGHEQAGRRPALVLSHHAYNAKVGLAICCPITNQAKGYPFEVPVGVANLSGVVLADQIKNLDWRVRRAEFIAAAPDEVLAEVLAKVRAVIE